VDSDGLLPASAVREVRAWLDDLATDKLARTSIIEQTLDGAVRQIIYRSYVLADAVVLQEDATAQLQGDVSTAYMDAVEGIEQALEDGSLLRGEVLSRWQEFVGAGDLARSMERHASRIRDRITSVVRGRGQSVQEVSAAVETGLHLLLLEQAENAADRARTAWASTQPGRTLLADAPGDLGRASRDFRERADRAVRDWQQRLLETVRTEGADKRATAKVLAYGVNGLAVTLMVVVFAGTAASPGSRSVSPVAAPSSGRRSSRRSSATRRCDVLLPRHARTCCAASQALLRRGAGPLPHCPGRRRCRPGRVHQAAGAGACGRRRPPGPGGLVSRLVEGARKLFGREAGVASRTA
jgi:hypothetical protein